MHLHVMENILPRLFLNDKYVFIIPQSQQYVYMLCCKSLYQLLNRKVHRARVKEDCACESQRNWSPSDHWNLLLKLETQITQLFYLFLWLFFFFWLVITIESANRLNREDIERLTKYDLPNESRQLTELFIYNINNGNSWFVGQKHLQKALVNIT